jgi:hypothetical protein
MKESKGKKNVNSRKKATIDSYHLAHLWRPLTTARVSTAIHFEDSGLMISPHSAGKHLQVGPLTGSSTQVSAILHSSTT